MKTFKKKKKWKKQKNRICFVFKLRRVQINSNSFTKKTKSDKIQKLLKKRLKNVFRFLIIYYTRYDVQN